jgi:hypothetical protein
MLARRICLKADFQCDRELAHLQGIGAWPRDGAECQNNGRCGTPRLPLS